MRSRILLVGTAAVLVACSTASPLPPLPANVAPDGAQTRSVDASILVDEASEPSLADVLDDARFETGREWTWTDRQGEVWRTVVRVLRFRSPDGADRYLEWVDGNVASLIGPAQATEGTPFVYVHDPSDCCPNKGGPQALAAAADGALVWTVTLSGPAADATRAVALLPSPGGD